MPKTKLLACKWCAHKTAKKDEHWEHIRTHLDSKKMLTCKSCPFVTEYKHHLEYHHRNHAGVKPYKCDKCDYQCVNMSMLKSHMKSHSPDCPYRCLTCGYTTKYAHSLKMHQKKYHQNAHHDRLMLDIFSPKNNNGGEAVKSGSSCASPASPNTTISSPTTNGTNTPTLSASPTVQVTNPEQYCILDLRIESKIKSG